MKQIVDPGVTGFIVNSIDEAVVQLPRLAALERAQVRRRFEARFAASRMAQDYLGLYRGLGQRETMKAYETGIQGVA
jgi:hypothetical protein